MPRWSRNCSARPSNRPRTDRSGALTTPANPVWNGEPREPGPTVVFDLDGVLSDAAGRQHFLDDARGRKDWRAFFDACGEDPLIAETARLLELLDPGLVVVLLTARPLRVQAETLAWLARYGVRWDLLVMRPGTEQRPTAAFKVDVVVGLRERGYDVRLAFEDDRRNVHALHAAGVPCVYLHSGYYD